MTPYAYTLGRDRPMLFPTLDAVVRYLIAEGATAATFLNRWNHSLRAHVAGTVENPDIDLTPYMVQAPIDEALLRAELMVRVADDRAEFEKAYPHGRGTERRMSGSNWLCESSPEELERILAREVERRSWKWKPLS